MKYFLLILFSLSFAVNISSQTPDSSFTELRGMEDNDGYTHLFYRFYWSTGNYPSYYTDQSIYQYNLFSGKDSLFLVCRSYGSVITFGDINVIDFNFWNNNPDKYIYSGMDCGIDCGSFIKRFDGYSEIPDNLGPISNIGISNQNDSVLYSSLSNKLIKSTDGGRNWFIVDSSAYVDFLSLSPFNDNIIFAVNEKYQLINSTDGGLTFSVADTTKLSTFQPLNFYYDKDSVHIYRIQAYINQYAKSNLYVSNSEGDSCTWHKKYSSDNPIYASVDYSKSGVIYISDGKDIYISQNYGNSFNKFETLSDNIVGLYKKPASSKLYAATARNIYEIIAGSTQSIKHIVVGVTNGKNNTPENFSLMQNYPNPFNPSTTISFTIPESEYVTLKVFDILGRLVTTLVNEEKSAGTYKVEFNSNNRPPTTNRQLSSGVYFYCLKTGKFISTKKMILMK